MGDTKRGRERKGRDKRKQQRMRMARRELDASDEPPEPEDDELRIGE